MSPFTRVASLQQPLAAQIRGLVDEFPSQSELLGLILIGSCSRGEATYRSDIDCLCILAEEPLNYQRVCALRNILETHLGEDRLTQPLRCEFHFVLPRAFLTEEPAMREALRSGMVLLDPSGSLRRAQLELQKRTA